MGRTWPPVSPCFHCYEQPNSLTTGSSLRPDPTSHSGHEGGCLCGAPLGQASAFGRALNPRFSPARAIKCRIQNRISLGKNLPDICDSSGPEQLETDTSTGRSIAAVLNLNCSHRPEAREPSVLAVRPTTTRATWPASPRCESTTLSPRPPRQPACRWARRPPG